MATAIQRIATGKNRSGIRCPHKGTAHRHTQHVGRVACRLPDDVDIATCKTEATEKEQIRPQQRRQHGLHDAKRKYLAHLRQALQRRLPGTALPTRMLHTGTVAKTQTAEMVRWANESIKLKLLYRMRCHELSVPS
jgi:hypothetical protein